MTISQFPTTTGTGGWVFSVGSLTFGGSLAVDTNIQQIIKNVLALP